MKCPGCGGDVPQVALKCKHCGAALRKQAAPPAAKPARPPKPEDPMRALAREAVEQQNEKRGTGKLGTPGPTGKPPAKRGNTGKLAPPTAEAADGAEAGGEAPPPPPRRDATTVAAARRKQLRVTTAVGVVLVLGAAAFSQSAYARNQLALWATKTAVRDVPFDVVEAEYLGAGIGQVRVPAGFSEITEGLLPGTRGLAFDLQLDLAFLGRRSAAFTLVGKRLRYEDMLAAAKAVAPRVREFQATYGKNAYRSIRYEQAPAEGVVGPPRTLRYYQSKKESENPIAIEFAYDEAPQARMIMDKVIDRVLTSIVE